MSDLGVTRDQVHERILLVAASVLLAVSASSRWIHDTKAAANTGTDHEYSGWGLVTFLDTSGAEPGEYALSPYLAFLLPLVLAVVVGGILLPPAEIGGWVGQVLGWVAIGLSAALVLLAISVGRNDEVDLGGGLVASAALSAGLAVLYFRTAQNPWPTADPRPSVGWRRKA
ncbi:hypothetical protein [Kribbella deserti]|uniref:Uncharacterized protein n=1 Tax=Kribbella deserti TaxID=1926257 RepID=A0ABV6QKT1_9ACTN